MHDTSNIFIKLFEIIVDIPSRALFLPIYTTINTIVVSKRQNYKDLIARIHTVAALLVIDQSRGSIGNCQFSFQRRE